MINMKWIALLVASSLMIAGCAVHMAANAPDRKDTKVLSIGNHRDLLLAELGQPIVTEKQPDDTRYDIFKFTKGFSGGEKFFHAAGHGVMDVATLGLWEVIGTPSEAMSQENEIQVKVLYDKNDTVTEIVPLKDKWGALK